MVGESIIVGDKEGSGVNETLMEGVGVVDIGVSVGVKEAEGVASPKTRSPLFKTKNFLVIEVSFP